MCVFEDIIDLHIDLHIHCHFLKADAYLFDLIWHGKLINFKSTSYWFVSGQPHFWCYKFYEILQDFVL